MYSSSSSLSGTPRRRHSRSSSVSSSQGSIKHDTRVHVFVRARPFDDITTDASIPLDYPSEKEIRLTDQKQETTYKFDHVFSPQSTNEEVCNVICAPLIDTVLDGYNGSFLVYGQTGTGKTFTVQSEDGLIPTTITELFNRIQKDKAHKYKVFMSYLQIYHERIYDLLDPNKDTDMHLREHPTEGIIIEGLTEFLISSTREAERLIGQGRRQLIVAETRLVRMSSRSHSLCLIRVEKMKVPTESITLSDGTDLMGLPPDFIKPEDACWKGKLYLCDLAGSERLKKSGVTGDRLKEARYINSSLLELGNVIHALSASKYQHIPFRNSTLTRLLKESLGGNSRASLMICISSSPHHISETKCSLNFGQRALRVTKSTSPNIEDEEASNGNEDNFSHIAQSYTIMKPRNPSMLLPKIDYKALSEYLSKKLKELETAYNNEKQSYVKMQEEMAATKKGVSRIPVPLTRKNSSLNNERARKFQETVDLKREDLAQIAEEKSKPQFEEENQINDQTEARIDECVTRIPLNQKKTQITGEDTIDGFSQQPKTLTDKQTSVDEIDVYRDPFREQDRPVDLSCKESKRSYITISSQTDENANLIMADNNDNVNPPIKKDWKSRSSERCLTESKDSLDSLECTTKKPLYQTISSQTDYSEYDAVHSHSKRNASVTAIDTYCIELTDKMHQYSELDQQEKSKSRVDGVTNPKGESSGNIDLSIEKRSVAIDQLSIENTYRADENRKRRQGKPDENVFSSKVDSIEHPVVQTAAETKYLVAVSKNPSEFYEAVEQAIDHTGIETKLITHDEQPNADGLRNEAAMICTTEMGTERSLVGKQTHLHCSEGYQELATKYDTTSCIPIAEINKRPVTSSASRLPREDITGTVGPGIDFHPELSLTEELYDTEMELSDVCAFECSRPENLNDTSMETEGKSKTKQRVEKDDASQDINAVSMQHRSKSLYEAILSTDDKGTHIAIDKGTIAAEDQRTPISHNEHTLIDIHKEAVAAHNLESNDQDTLIPLAQTDLKDRNEKSSHDENAVVDHHKKTLVADAERRLSAENGNSHIANDGSSLCSQNEMTLATAKGNVVHDQRAFSHQDKNSAIGQEEETLFSHSEISGFVEDESTLVAHDESTLVGQNDRMLVHHNKNPASSHDKSTDNHRDEDTTATHIETNQNAHEEQTTDAHSVRFASANENSGIPASEKMTPTVQNARSEDETSLVDHQERPLAAEHQRSAYVPGETALVAHEEQMVVAYNVRSASAENETAVADYKEQIDARRTEEFTTSAGETTLLAHVERHLAAQHQTFASLHDEMSFVANEKQIVAAHEEQAAAIPKEMSTSATKTTRVVHEKRNLTAHHQRSAFVHNEANVVGRKEQMVVADSQTSAPAQDEIALTANNKKTDASQNEKCASADHEITLKNHEESNLAAQPQSSGYNETTLVAHEGKTIAAINRTTSLAQTEIALSASNKRTEASKSIMCASADHEITVTDHEKCNLAAQPQRSVSRHNETTLIAPEERIVTADNELSIHVRDETELASPIALTSQNTGSACDETTLVTHDGTCRVTQDKGTFSVGDYTTTRTANLKTASVAEDISEASIDLKSLEVKGGLSSCVTVNKYNEQYFDQALSRTKELDTQSAADSVLPKIGIDVADSLKLSDADKSIEMEKISLAHEKEIVKQPIAQRHAENKILEKTDYSLLEAKEQEQQRFDDVGFVSLEPIITGQDNSATCLAKNVNKPTLDLNKNEDIQVTDLSLVTNGSESERKKETLDSCKENEKFVLARGARLNMLVGGGTEDRDVIQSIEHDSKHSDSMLYVRKEVQKEQHTIPNRVKCSDIDSFEEPLEHEIHASEKGSKLDRNNITRFEAKEIDAGINETGTVDGSLENRELSIKPLRKENESCANNDTVKFAVHRDDESGFNHNNEQNYSNSASKSECESNKLCQSIGKIVNTNIQKQSSSDTIFKTGNIEGNDCGIEGLRNESIADTSNLQSERFPTVDDVDVAKSSKISLSSSSKNIQTSKLEQNLEQGCLFSADKPLQPEMLLDTRLSADSFGTEIGSTLRLQQSGDETNESAFEGVTRKTANVEEMIIPQNVHSTSNAVYDSFFDLEIESLIDKKNERLIPEYQGADSHQQTPKYQEKSEVEKPFRVVGDKSNYKDTNREYKNPEHETDRAGQTARQRLPLGSNIVASDSFPLHSSLLQTEADVKALTEYEQLRSGNSDLIDFQIPRISNTTKEKEREKFHDSAEDNFSLLQGIVTDNQQPSIREAVIVDNSEVNRQRFRPVSIGEARKLASPIDDDTKAKTSSGLSDCLPGRASGKETRKEIKIVDFLSKDNANSPESDAIGFNPNTPLIQLSPMSSEAQGHSFSYSRGSSASPSPSCTSTDSEICHALREKEKLKTALNSVKSQYEGLLQEFDRIIANNSGENEENTKISKESYQMALKCKEELEVELSKAKEQLALVIAAHEEQREGLMWQTSDSEYSEDTESVFPEESEDGEHTPRATSTPVPAKDTDAKVTDARYENSSKAGRNIKELNMSKIEHTEQQTQKAGNKEKTVFSSVEQETAPATSDASIGCDLLSLAYKVTGQNQEDKSPVEDRMIGQKGAAKGKNPESVFHKFQSSELQRLPATLPRRRGSTRRPKTMILEEGDSSEFKWINKRSATSEEQARRNQKLALQAIENAELKKELLLTKLEKIRLEAMLSCVMMRLSPNEVDSSFRKISVNSITSSSSTLRSTASLTNIPQSDPTSPFQPMSPIRRTNPRVGSSLSGQTSSPSHPRVRFGDAHKAQSSTMSPRSSSLFGHLSQLTQSSLSPSSLDFDISSCTSSEFPESPVPLERFSPYGQNDDDDFNSPLATSKGKPDGHPGGGELAVAYKGKNKLLLTACLPFLRKKKSSKKHSKGDERVRKDSYGADC